MRKIYILLIWTALFATFPVSAQETLPPYHWANNYVDYLKVRGYLPALSVIDRPFSRDDIARQLLKIDWDRKTITAKDRQIIKLLYQEFTGEFEVLANSSLEEWRDLIKNSADLLDIETKFDEETPRIKGGVFGEAEWRNSRETDSEFNFHLHTQTGLRWRNAVTLYNNLRIFDQADSNYIGKEYKSLFAFVEQGYLAIQQDWFQAKFGRDWLQTGPGRSAQLLFSDNSRPFDMYQVRIGKGPLQFAFWGIQLDQVFNREPSRFFARRYINAHRLSLNLGNKVFLGVSEVVLYGGENRGWDLNYINPVGIYYAANVNQEPGVPSNNLLYNIDWDLYLKSNLEIYGEFLLDDYQIDNEQPGDLEPNEWGVLLGVHWADPGGWNGSLLNFEYTQVRNRTYNVADTDWGKYLHRNEVIGHFLGNNFERFDLAATYWLKPQLYLKAFANLTRQGEGRVSGAFNVDFQNFTVEEGYHEAFPFGIVERSWQSGLSLFYQPHKVGNFRIDLSYDDVNNFKHVPEKGFSDVKIKLTGWFQWNRLW